MPENHWIVLQAPHSQLGYGVLLSHTLAIIGNGFPLHGPVFRTGPHVPEMGIVRMRAIADVLDALLRAVAHQRARHASPAC